LAVDPHTSLGYPKLVGAPRHIAPGDLEPPDPAKGHPGVACVFPLGTKGRPYYRDTCGIAASPQATLELPLAKIDALTNAIRTSEKHRVAGRALSAPSGGSYRMGVRSQALYDAQRAVNASRKRHIKAKTRLSDGTLVTARNYSPTLQGLLILIVSYLRTSELKYDDRDYEGFAKAYLPLNVKNPLRVLFADLTPEEKRVFTDLYDSPREHLWQLARGTEHASRADGAKQLFPVKVGGHQKCWFHAAPTWNDFIEKTVTNTPLTRETVCTSPEKKGEGLNCEVLFAPLSRIMPYTAGSRRVTIEMRRLGFNWVYSHSFKSGGVNHRGWLEMTRSIFDLAVRLNQ
jgi:hypothetical protein